IFDRAIDHSVNDEAMPHRIDVRYSAMMAFVVKPGRGNDAVASVHRRERSGPRRVGPSDLAFELRPRPITPVSAHHAARLLRRVLRHRIFYRSRRSLCMGRLRQHRGHSDGGDQSGTAEQLAPARSKRKHSLFALTIFPHANLSCLRLGYSLPELSDG